MKVQVFLFLAVFSLINIGETVAQKKLTSVAGAWQTGTPENQSTMICSDKYFAVAIYDLKNKRYIGTYGGSYRLEGNGYVANIEFHSIYPEVVGTEVRGSIRSVNGNIEIEGDGSYAEWKRLDEGGPGKLAGAWLITGRVRDGKMSAMTPGARRTMKILSGTRFQWIAYNVETKEISGTGGGTYTTKDGKYTEHIEFFSRDNSRVGQSLVFDYSLENGAWRHKGLSSRGEPIDEVWTKRENIKL